jgi:hypothetical protein
LSGAVPVRPDAVGAERVDRDEEEILRCLSRSGRSLVRAPARHDRENLRKNDKKTGDR